VNAGADLEMLLRVVGSLVAVVALALVAARLARRAGMRGEGVGMRVVDRIGLTRDGALTVVEVCGRVLVLGVTTTSVTLVTELDPGTATAPASHSSASNESASNESASNGSASNGSVLDPRTWAQGLDVLRELTVRR